MARNSQDTLAKLAKLEEQKKEIIAARNKELLAIITRCNAFTIDNKLLSNFMQFATNPNNKNHPLLKELTTVMSSTATPSKSKQLSSKSAKKNN